LRISLQLRGGRGEVQTCEIFSLAQTTKSAQRGHFHDAATQIKKNHEKKKKIRKYYDTHTNAQRNGKQILKILRKSA